MDDDERIYRLEEALRVALLTSADYWRTDEARAAAERVLNDNETDEDIELLEKTL